jgi:hypothetical protein
MSAGYQEIFLEQGASFNTSITLDDVYGEAYNLQNYSAFSQIRKSYYSSNATATFSTIVNGALGVITLSLNAPTTANIKPGRYLYDVLIYSKTDAANNTIRVLEGTINVTPSVSKV